MTKKAISLVEVLVILSILLLLAALLLPVFVKTVEASKMAVSKSNLRQIGLATALYRTENDGDGIFGPAWQMGLPCDPQPDHLTILNELKPPMNSHPSAIKVGNSYKQIFSGSDNFYGKHWAPYAVEAQSKTVIFVDPFFNPGDVDLAYTQFYPTRLIALRIDTSVFVTSKRGEWDTPRFWHDHYTTEK